MRPFRALLLLLAVVAAALLAVLFWQNEPAAPTTTESAAAGGAAAQSQPQPAAPLPAGDLEHAPAPGRTESLAQLPLRAVLPDGTTPRSCRFLIREEGAASSLEGAAGAAAVARSDRALQVAAVADGWWSDVMDCSAAERRELAEIRLRGAVRSAALDLQVRDGFGAPLPAFTAALEWTDLLEAQGAADQRRAQWFCQAWGQAAGAAGACRWADVPPGLYSVAVSSDEHAPLLSAVRLPPGAREQLSLTVASGAFVRGRLLSAGGGAIEAGLVYLLPGSAADLLGYGLERESLSALAPRGGQGRSGADGAFRIGPVAEGSYLLYAEAPGFLPHRGEQALALAANLTHEAGDLLLEPGWSLTLQVVRQEDQQPIAGARVRYYPGKRSEGFLSGLTPWRDPEPSRTGEGGTLSIPALPEDGVSLYVEAEGRAARELVVERQEAGATPYPVALAAELFLEGVVLDAVTRLPVAAAEIRPRAQEGGDFLSELMPAELGNRAQTEAESDDAGRFRVAGLGAGAWSIHVSAEGYAAADAGPFLLREGEPRDDLVVELRPGASLTVTVLDREGSPRVGTTVSLFSFGGGDLRAEQTGEQGQILFEHLRPATYQVQALPESFGEGNFLQGLSGGFESTSDFVTLEEGRHHELVLGGAVEEATVQGFVYRGEEPAAGLMVMLASGAYFKSAQTDATGWYELSEVPAGDYMLMVGRFQMGSGSGWYGELRVAGGGTVQHDVELPESHIEVLVLDDESGEPLQGIMVMLRPRYGVSTAGGGFLSTGADGRVAFDYIQPGRYTLSAGKAAFSMMGGGTEHATRLLEEEIEIPEQGPFRREYTVRLERAAVLEVKVADQSGSAVADAGVFLLDEAGQPISQFSLRGTGPDGRTRLESLPPGRNRVLARKQGAGQVEKEVWLTSGETTQVELVLEAGTLLKILVVDEQGKPLPGVQVVAIDRRGSPLSAMVAMNEAMTAGLAFLQGREQVLGPLPPGDYTLLLQRLSGQNMRHPVTVAPGVAEMPLVLTFRP